MTLGEIKSRRLAALMPQPQKAPEEPKAVAEAVPAQPGFTDRMVEALLTNEDNTAGAGDFEITEAIAIDPEAPGGFTVMHETLQTRIASCRAARRSIPERFSPDDTLTAAIRRVV
jgi:hypothetical protein